MLVWQCYTYVVCPLTVFKNRVIPVIPAFQNIGFNFQETPLDVVKEVGIVGNFALVWAEYK